MQPHIASALKTAPAIPVIRCETCNGIGHGYSDNGPAPRDVTCWDCDGIGTWEAEWHCPQCDDVLEGETAFCMSCREVVGGYAA